MSKTGKKALSSFSLESRVGGRYKQDNKNVQNVKYQEVLIIKFKAREGNWEDGEAVN